MTKKNPSKKTGPRSTPPLVANLRALLHTIRCIRQHEDPLCSLLHNLENAPEDSAELHDELRELLDQLPGRDYMDDLEAVIEALPPIASQSDPSQGTRPEQE